MDEAAEKAGVDPLAFRLRMLDAAGRNAGSAPNSVGGAKRQAAVLQRVATKAGWGQKLPAIARTANPPADRGWHVNGQGMTMLAIPAGTLPTPREPRTASQTS